MEVLCGLLPFVEGPHDDDDFDEDETLHNPPGGYTINPFLPVRTLLTIFMQESHGSGVW